MVGLVIHGQCRPWSAVLSRGGARDPVPVPLECRRDPWWGSWSMAPVPLECRC